MLVKEYMNESDIVFGGVYFDQYAYGPSHSLLLHKQHKANALTLMEAYKFVIVLELR